MKTILLSVAHAADSIDRDELIANERHPMGAMTGSYSEYDVSKAISERIFMYLKSLQVPCHLFDASDGFAHLKYGRILQRKIQWVNHLCHDLGSRNCIAIEIHHNSVNSRGYSVHYCAGSMAGRAASKIVLERFAGRWTVPQPPDPNDPERIAGLYERPGWYGGGVSFLSDTLCPAIITEAESIAWPDLMDRLDEEAEIIREALCRMVGS